MPHWGGGETLSTLANASTQSQQSIPEFTTEIGGLISPKADDPVIYTTESGLAIKYGNALPNTYHGSLESGNLQGFPYFTTTKSGTEYTWVIIGRNSNVDLFSDTITNHIFSSWRTNAYPNATYSKYNTTPYAKYFFDNIHEISTPAGSAINSETSKSYVNDYIKNTLPKTNAEIPSGCVLALLNSYTTSVAYYQSANLANVWDTFQDSYIYSDAYGGPTSGLRIYCNPYTTCYNYATNDTFGFGSLLSSLEQPTLYQRAYFTSTNVNNVGISGGKQIASNLKFFPLGGSNYSEENFKWENYLTANQYKTTVNVWCRGTYNVSSPYYTNTSGTIAYFSEATATAYLRPACVIKLS